MIRLDININPDDIISNSAKYNEDVKSALQNMSNLVPGQAEENFVKKLWKHFQQTLWTQQGEKCAFCEKTIIMDDANVEHFRPKTEVRNEDNSILTREAYWWLAYDHRNYIASCPVCNRQKGNYFPILNEGNRVETPDLAGIIHLTIDGVLGGEQPLLINPRFADPEQHLIYQYAPNPLTPMVYVVEAEEDEVGKKTISILDLNRSRKNKKILKDNLPGKRGTVLSAFKKEINKYESYREALLNYRRTLVAAPNPNLQELIENQQLELNNKKRVIISRYLSVKAEFSGMCRFWLRNDTNLEVDFLEIAA